MGERASVTAPAPVFTSQFTSRLVAAATRTLPGRGGAPRDQPCSSQKDYGVHGRRWVNQSGSREPFAKIQALSPEDAPSDACRRRIY